jgi:lactate dehydrogenase-like 2-hydroxyacid dehydrogenase
MREGNWNRKPRNPQMSLSSSLLSGKKVGIIGYGAIGQKIGSFLVPYDVIINVLEKQRDRIVHCKEVYKTFDETNINDFLSDLDIIIVSVPLTDSTRGLFSNDLFQFIKNGVLLINTSRAEIINEDALYEALLSRKLAGFASDVWYNTPKRGESQAMPSLKNKFEELDNVVFSPHRAGFSDSGFPHLDDAIDNICRLAEGKELRNQINFINQY